MNYIETIKKNRAFRLWDLAVFLLLVVAIVFSVVFALSPKGEYAEVFVDGKLVETLYLNNAATTEVEGVVIVVADGEIFVASADCPDKLCVAHSAISEKGSSIICLPNKVVIRVNGKSQTDAII